MVLRITTYINNLHPERHRDLYGIINQVLTRVVPMWSATLWPLRQEFDDWKLRIPYGECEYDEGPQQEDGESDDDYNKRREPWLAETRRLFPPLPATMTSFLLDVQEKTRRVVLPEPAMYLPTLASTVPSLKVKHTSLQVIVKLANIELTPEKPEYAGGSWHVEGQLVRLLKYGSDLRLLCLRTNTSVPRLYIIILVTTLIPLNSHSVNKATPSYLKTSPTSNTIMIG